MKENDVRTLARDSLWLVLMSLVAATLVFQLAASSNNLLPALAVLAFMTPVVASTAVQLYRDLDRYRSGGGGQASP